MIKTFDYSNLPCDYFSTTSVNVSKDIERTVSEIIADVRERGDAAVLAYTKRFDGAELNTLLVTDIEMEQAEREVPPQLCEVMHEAAENIRGFHKNQLTDGFRIEREDGTILGQRVTPIEKVGIYVPGGTASYPSTVLMDAVPARLAGVSELIMCTPPDKNGRIAPSVLAAARIAGVDKVYKCGGAQAVAAMAYGTQSIGRVSKIVGPGNVFVATAKRMVFGLVDIDMIAGPSDVLIIADENANAVHVAADMLAQAEHDKLARAILLTTSHRFAKQVEAELTSQLQTLPRAEIAFAAIKSGSAIIICDSLDDAARCSDEIAPEHLELYVAQPWTLFEKVRNAGSIFVGGNSPEALGDYFAGPNHTLPTMGTARFASPLSVEDFVKRSSYTYYTHAALKAATPKIATFARSEGLDAHARSCELRMSDE